MPRCRGGACAGAGCAEQPKQRLGPAHGIVWSGFGPRGGGWRAVRARAGVHLHDLGGALDGLGGSGGGGRLLAHPELDEDLGLLECLLGGDRNGFSLIWFEIDFGDKVQPRLHHLVVTCAHEPVGVGWDGRGESVALGRGLGMRALPGNAGTIVLSGSCARLTLLYKDLASLSAAASRLSPHHSRLLCEKEVWAGTSRTSTSATFRLPRDGRFLSRAFSSLNCEHKRVRCQGGGRCESERERGAPCRPSRR